MKKQTLSYVFSDDAHIPCGGGYCCTLVFRIGPYVAAVLAGSKASLLRERFRLRRNQLLKYESECTYAIVGGHLNNPKCNCDSIGFNTGHCDQRYANIWATP